MKTVFKLGCAFALVFGAVSCTTESPAENKDDSTKSSASSAKGVDYSAGHAMNKILGRGINLGNSFDAQCGTVPVEPASGWDGCWNNAIQPTDIATVKAAGFQSIRLPIRWAEKAPDEAPFTINPSVTARVKAVVDQAIANGLAVIINIHHYNELYDESKTRTDFELQKEKFVALWTQIADQFKEYPNDKLVFELLNEGRGRVTDAELNGLIAKVWPIIRASNPGRTIMLNPSYWGAFAQLTTLDFPEDGNVILSGHYYFPHEFSHQGTSGQYPVGVSWGTKTEREDVSIRVAMTLEKLKEKWPGVDGGTVPVNIGEFGAAMDANLVERALYAQTIREVCERRGISWHFWGFTHVNFDAYNRSTNAWIPEIIQALIPQQAGN